MCVGYGTRLRGELPDSFLRVRDRAALLLVGSPRRGQLWAPIEDETKKKQAPWKLKTAREETRHRQTKLYYRNADVVDWKKAKPA